MQKILIKEFLNIQFLRDILLKMQQYVKKKTGIFGYYYYEMVLVNRGHSWQHEFININLP